MTGVSSFFSYTDFKKRKGEMTYENVESIVYPSGVYGEGH